MSYSELSFSLFFSRISPCETIEGFAEWIEFSILLSSIPKEWIPLILVYHNTTNSNIEELDNFTLRGFTLENRLRPVVVSNSLKETISLKLCGKPISNPSIHDHFQFRWLQTSKFSKGSTPKDLWSLDDVKISFVNSSGSTVLLEESFENNTLE